MDGGWLKLYRCLIKKPIWQCTTPEQKAILITLLCMANHEEKEWIWQGKKYKCQPGQMVTSLKSIAENSGTSIRNVRTALKNFEETYEFLTSISTNRNRLITITNWELYQSNNEKPTSKLTGNRQASDKQVTTNKNDKNDKNDKNIYSSEIIRMAEKLKSLILENNPGARTPKDLTKWQSEFDKMKRLDKRTDEQIYAVMEFSQTDPFWKSNILSAKKLREKFDTLILQKDRNKPQNKFKPPQAANFEQRQYSDKDFDNLYKEV